MGTGWTTTLTRLSRALIGEGRNLPKKRSTDEGYELLQADGKDRDAPRMFAGGRCESLSPNIVRGVFFSNPHDAVALFVKGQVCQTFVRAPLKEPGI